MAPKAKPNGRMPPPRRPKGSPKVGGRKKGTPNKATVEVKAAAALIVDDPIYRANVLKRARKGKLAPAVECMLWHYAKGKPKEMIEVDLKARNVDTLTDAELAQRAAALARALTVPLIDESADL